MNANTSLGVSLSSRFATELPELAVAWQAEPAPEPRLLVLNEPLAAALGFDPDWLRTASGVRYLVGADVPAGAVPVAQAYAGHQFGGWVPQLGDGRALLLGELTGADGQLCDLALKGSGRTPFARGGDGRAAVGPMLREHVISEAMHALGIPTTRSLAVVATGRAVRRELPLPGALLVRVAASHLRVGSFSYAAASGDLDLLRRLRDFAIGRHYPEAAQAESPALALFDAVVSAQAELVAGWMAVGFVHGVMNTDNMTVSGETIDYGPCAFLDVFDPTAVFSSIDETGRYAYGNQPMAAEWNLARLGEALLPLLADDQDQAVERATEALGAFRPQYAAALLARRKASLGISEVDNAVARPLVDDLLDLAQVGRVDLTALLRALGHAARGNTEPARANIQDLARFDAWAARWLALAPAAAAMHRVNPAYVPRNHLVEQALTAATAGDLAPLDELLDAVTAPYDERPGREDYATADPTAAPYVTYCGT